MFLTMLIIVLAILVAISIEDLSNRTLDLRVATALFLICLLRTYLNHGIIFGFMMNVLIAFVLVGLLGIYYMIKDRCVGNSLLHRFGTGDLIFFVAIAPMFLIKAYLLFIITGMIAVLIQHFLVVLFRKSCTVPLAGFLANYLIVLIVLKNFFRIDVLSYFNETGLY